MDIIQLDGNNEIKEYDKISELFKIKVLYIGYTVLIMPVHESHSVKLDCCDIVLSWP